MANRISSNSGHPCNIIQCGPVPLQTNKRLPQIRRKRNSIMADYEAFLAALKMYANRRLHA